MVAQPKEAVGPSYNIESKRLAQAMTWRATERLSAGAGSGNGLGLEPQYQGLWILEIQIAHPDLPYGAFFEDLLA